MPTEVWRPVPIPEIADLYEVSDLGEVRNAKTGWTLKGKLDKYGYRQVSIRVRGMDYRKDFLVHRLVAGSFVPLVEGTDQVDHIDQDRTNNHAGNLRWCDAQINNCNRKDQSHLGAHLSEMTLGGKHEYWRVNFQGKGVKLLKNFNKKDMPLESVQKLRDILAEDLGFA
jgi:uncharacterized protein YxeA